LITLNGEKQQKTNTLQNIQKQLHQAEVQREGLRCHKCRLMERMEQQITVEARLSAKQKQLENLEQDKVDPELEKASCRKDNQV
jgi:hypothetical protein